MTVAAPPTMSVAFLHPFIEAMEAHGCGRDELANWLRLPSGALDDAATALPARTVYRFLARCSEHVGDPTLGARLGRHMARGGWAPIRPLLEDSKTVSGFLVRFSKVAADQGGAVTYRLEAEGPAAWWKLSRPQPVPPEARHADATAIGFFVEVLRQATGADWNPDRVVAVVADASLVPVQVLPPSSLISGSTSAALRFPSDWFECPLPRFDPAPDLPSLSLPKIGITGLQDRVQQIIERHLSDPEYGLDDVARAMGVPSWKLQTILRTSGTRFAELRNLTRLKVAEDRLRHSDDPVSEIATALGYLSVSNFSRAFRAWTGTSPSAFRARLLNDGKSR